MKSQQWRHGVHNPNENQHQTKIQSMFEGAYLVFCTPKIFINNKTDVKSRKSSGTRKSKKQNPKSKTNF
ncbi:hypothetical protein Hanom_Chr14g01327721 [Helianthus anomalus]